MTIKQVKNIVDFVANKYQLGYLSGDEFNNVFRLAELGYLSFLIGNLHQYSPGRPVPRVGLDMTKASVEKLSPFRFTITVNAGASGEVYKQTDMAALEAMNKSDGTRVYMVAPNRLSYYLNSSVWDLTTQPIYAEYDTYYQVYPSSIDIILTGIRFPPQSKWAFTYAGDQQVYDNLNSSDPIWKDMDTVEIIGRMCKHIGVSLKDGELMNYAQSIINQGE